MQQPQRYIPSVSDLYGTDEIELLLDEIRELELEPAVCCQLDDEQDFEIAGSRAGELSLSLESPLGTCTSWDSHANYKQQQQTPLPWGVALHCDPQHLKTPTGIVRILLVVSVCVIDRYLSSQISTRFPYSFIPQLSSAVCLACECSAGTVQVGLFLLPLIGRLRLMVFCALFSLLITCLMIFLDISHIALMFPFNWTKVVRIVEQLYSFLSIYKTFVFKLSSLSLSSEHVDVPEHWFNIYFELHAARPHGALCDGIHIGIQALQGHTTSDRRKYPGPYTKYSIIH